MAETPVTKYLEAMSSSFELLAEGGAKASERGARISKKFADQAILAQRESLTMARRLAEDPEHVLSSSYSSLTESAVAAQTRALSFAQMLYQEALESSSEAREMSEKLAEANKDTASAASELSRSWASMNPFSEFVARGMETGMEAATASTKKR